MVVIFDVLGTLFSLYRIKDRFREKGMRSEIMELWFSKLLQSSMAATLAGKYAPFKVVAQSTLKQIFALENIRQKNKDCEDLLASIAEVEPWGDTVECLHALREDGHRLAALTNSAIADTEQMLERWAIRSEFERVFSADDVKACKPNGALYEMLFRAVFAGPYECCMVSAHGWDILGAESVGMNTIYVNRIEKEWPFPGSPAGVVVPGLRDVPGTILRRFRRREEWKNVA